MTEPELPARIVVDPDMYGGKPIIQERRLAVEHILGMLVVGDSGQVILEGYPWFEPEDVQGRLISARVNI